MNIKPNTRQFQTAAYQNGRVHGEMGRKSQAHFYREWSGDRDNYEMGYRDGKRLRNRAIEREGDRG